MPAVWEIVADAIVVVHAAYVFAVVGGFIAIVAGGAVGARWTRTFAIRAGHLAMIALVCAESALGAACPLTVWENAARVRAGEAALRGDFIGRALDALIFYNAPARVFSTVYFAFGVAVIATWIFIPVEWPRIRGSNQTVSTP